MADTEVGSESRSSVGGMRRRRMISVFVVLGLVALVALIATLVFGDDGDDVADEPTVPAIDRVAADSTSSGADVPAGPVARSGDPNFPPSDDHLASDRIADLFRLDIDGDRRYAVVYPSQMGLQMLSSDGATVPELKVAVGFEEAVRFPLLSNGEQTWAVDPSDLSTVYLVSTQFEVVDIGLEGAVAFINPSIAPTNIGISSFGAWGPGFDVPVGSEIMGVPGRGLLIVPATGGTYRLTRRGVGVEKVSDDRVVAAGMQSEVYERCDEVLVCELYVTGVDNTEGTRLDVGVTSQVYISPLGEFVLIASGDVAQIIEIETGDRWDVAEGAISAAGWSPDGRFVAFVSGNDVVLGFPNDRRGRTPDLANIADVVSSARRGRTDWGPAIFETTAR